MTKDKVGMLVANPREEVSYGLGYTLDGINIRYKDTTVLMVVKARGQVGGKKVAFIECATAWDCWEYLAAACYSTSVVLQWRDDKW